MQFSSIISVLGMAVLAAAQNPFSFTTLTSVTAGTPFNITWSPSTGTTDTVSLILRRGESSALDTILTIASKIQNTGSYLWTPPNTLVAGSGYAFQIVDDGNTSIVNYSLQFSIISTNTVSSSASKTASSSGSVSAKTSGSTSVTGTSTGTAASATASGSGSTTSATGSQTSASKTTSASSSTGTGSAATTAPTGAGNSLKAGMGLMGVLGVMAVL